MNWRVIVDVTVAAEVSAFAEWLERWRDQVVLSENEGCGCCVDIWQVEGPEGAKSDLPSNLIEFVSSVT